MPTYQGAVESNYSGGAPARFAQDAQQLAPLTTTLVIPNAPQFAAPATIAQSTNSGVLPAIGHFLGSVAGTVGSLGAAAGKFVGHSLESMALAPIHYGEGLGNAILDNQSLDSINKTSAAISAKIANLNSQFKAGLVSAHDYNQGLKAYNQEFSDLTSENKNINKKILSDSVNARQATIDTAATLLAVMTFGGAAGAEAVNVGLDGLTPTLTPDLAAKSAGEFLMSKTPDAVMKPVEDALARIGLKPDVFSKLSPSAQEAINTATAEVISKGAAMSGGQIARASAANLALKYPLMFSYLSGTGTQIYKELQNKKYGDAVNTLAFNAAIAIGGGVFGEGAIHAAGKAYGAARDALFARSTFTDTLSKELFGEEDALFNAAKGNSSRIKALSDLEATHMKATNGDAVAAAWRVINGERSYDGLNTIEHGPDGWLDHNIKWARNAKLANTIAAKYNLGPVSVGRWTGANAKMVHDAVMQSTTTEGQLGVWDSLKKQYPDSAFANNANLDNQISNLIKAGKADQIQHVQAGFFLKGFPETESRAMAKEGFIPISGAGHASSFTEGTGELSSKFANGEEFFTKAATPLPVLSSVGALLTNVGLSPNASNELVGELYNSNLAQNLRKTSVAKKVADYLNDKGIAQEPTKAASGAFSPQELKELEKQGYTPAMIEKLGKGEFNDGAIPTSQLEEPQEELPSKGEKDGADYIRKIISGYAANPTRRGLSGVAIRDERQMTYKDLRTAFAKNGISLNNDEAKELQDAISMSHLKIQTATKGLGDKLVDVLYGAPGLRMVERRFLRLQGAIRFDINPFFQYLRAVPKLEILSESQGGGYVRSIFSGRLKEMGEVREGLREAGFLNKTGKLGNVVTDEGIITSRNLSHRLLRPQENSIAGLVDSMAQKTGMTWQDYIKANPDAVKDIIQSTAEYDRHSQFLNSPLARTLNIAFFPFRFDSKVLAIMTKSLARQDWLTKVAVIQGVAKGHEFLNSPAGKAWYQQNADAIGLFKYITPLASFNEIFDSLLPGHSHALGNFGELGGLPFGWIPQMLDAEGITQFNQPGVDAKTGAIFPQYIPKTSRGQVAIAIQDLLGSMFSYPGATVGLPSKSSITRNAALGLTMGSKSKDFQLTTPHTPYGQTIQNMLHGPVNEPVQSTQTQTIPVRPTSITQPVAKSSGSGRSKKLKKSQIIPALLPGQSSLGQL